MHAGREALALFHDGKHVLQPLPDGPGQKGESPHDVACPSERKAAETNQIEPARDNEHAGQRRRRYGCEAETRVGQRAQQSHEGERHCVCDPARDHHGQSFDRLLR
jgi:hypothetical protein